MAGGGLKVGIPFETHPKATKSYKTSYKHHSKLYPKVISTVKPMVSNTSIFDYQPHGAWGRLETSILTGFSIIGL